MKSPKRRSILKRPSDANEKSNVTKKKTSIAEMKNITRVMENESSFQDKVFLSNNLTFTKIGICYTPPVEDVPSNSKIQRTKISECQRPDFRELLREDDDVASVLIVGDKIMCEGFQSELENIGEMFRYTQKLKCKSTVDPTLQEIMETDFFLFLVQLEKCYCVAEVRPRVLQVRDHLRGLSFRSAFVGISSPSGPYDDAVPWKEYHDLQVEFQIPAFSFCIIDRDRKSFTLDNIRKTIFNCCNRSSSDALISWGFSVPVQGQDTLL